MYDNARVLMSTRPRRPTNAAYEIRRRRYSRASHSVPMTRRRITPASIHRPRRAFQRPKVEPPYFLFIDFNLLIALHLSDTPARCAFSLNMNSSLHIWYLFLFLLLFIAHLFAFSSNISVSNYAMFYSPILAFLFHMHTYILYTN